MPVPVVPQPSLPTASVLMVPDCKPRMFLGQYTEEVAVALCDVIVSALHLTLTGDDTAYMHPQAPTRIDWEKVADAVKGCTPLQSALECQRLWKYIAYGEDTGGKGPNLAPDTDSDDT